MNVLSWLDDIKPQGSVDDPVDGLVDDPAPEVPNSRKRRRLARLEDADKSIIAAQIDRSDPRMPTELQMMLNALEIFQSRTDIVPSYLAPSIERRAKWDANFYNFRPAAFQNGEATENTTTDNATALDPGLSLDRVLEVFSAAKECFNGAHPEATWNTLVHWPIFQLALGAVVDAPKAPPEEEEDGIQEQRQEHRVRVRAMPCATARLKGNQRGKMVDYCMFVEPQDEDLTKLMELWKHPQLDCNINHTDHYSLRQRPVVLSATSKRPGEGFAEAQVQLSVWQGAQWAPLESLMEITKGGGKDAARPLIPFLPALVIQGHEWSFVATTRSGKQTVHPSLDSPSHRDIF
ncbi:putative methyltransferase type 11 [Rosellinia necatrix]|uniref:Putative methyltransferase type 11 n=1 Tax=Rosellinia necatrix TaxID=77044 RepID=A0A1W2TPC0_ROSNE|nr:putative methyltransferase type 11 [Rosellinia necatrix]